MTRASVERQSQDSIPGSQKRKALVLHEVPLEATSAKWGLRQPQGSCLGHRPFSGTFAHCRSTTSDSLRKQVEAGRSIPVWEDQGGPSEARARPCVWARRQLAFDPGLRHGAASDVRRQTPCEAQTPGTHQTLAASLALRPDFFLPSQGTEVAAIVTTQTAEVPGTRLPHPEEKKRLGHVRPPGLCPIPALPTASPPAL